MEAKLALKRAAEALAKVGNPNHDAKGRFSSASGAGGTADHAALRNQAKVRALVAHHIPLVHQSDWKKEHHQEFNSIAETKPGKLVHIGRTTPYPNGTPKHVKVRFWHGKKNTFVNYNTGDDPYMASGHLSAGQVKAAAQKTWDSPT